MDKRNAVVPEGMSNEARSKFERVGLEDGEAFVHFSQGMHFACQWLQENPIEATEKDWTDFCVDSPGVGSAPFVAWWQKNRMFRAPEPDPYEDLLRDCLDKAPEGACAVVLYDGYGNVLASRTVLSAVREADAKHCPACTILGQSLERGEGTHLEGTVEHPDDPDDKIRDLLEIDSQRCGNSVDHNKDVREAFRRGRESK